MSKKFQSYFESLFTSADSKTFLQLDPSLRISTLVFTFFDLLATTVKPACALKCSYLTVAAFFVCFSELIKVAFSVALCRSRPVEDSLARSLVCIGFVGTAAPDSERQLFK